MTLSAEDKNALSHYRLQKAKEFLDDAKKNFDEGRYRTSLNRSYYAALHAARALLILEGANPVTHDGIVTMLSLKFVKTGQLSPNYIKIFKTLLSRRTDVDYGDFDTIDKDETFESYTNAAEFISTVEKLQKSIIL